MLTQIDVAVSRHQATMIQDFLIQMLTHKTIRAMAKSETALFNGSTGLPAYYFFLSNKHIDHIIRINCTRTANIIYILTCVIDYILYIELTYSVKS